MTTLHPPRSAPRVVRRDLGADLVLVDVERDQHVRWSPGERLHELFERRVDDTPDAPAVDAGELRRTYRELDADANRLARLLLARGVGPGDRVALLFDDAPTSYAALLAVLKVHAAYVPLDTSFPADRLAYICADAEVRAVLTLDHLHGHLSDVDAEVVDAAVSDASGTGDGGARLTDAERGEPVDELAYVVYTSGSTGRPKGVAVEHAAIGNFVRVAAEVYGIRADDRVYQGMTIAFDFSVEEMWVPWIAGATLVPRPPGGALLGAELHAFLTERAVTALCCVPTLLATLDGDLPGLRFVLVSGEACPQDLVARWHRPDRRFLNVYGPTEATVTATWTTLEPGRPVTIGVPLPTYSTVTLDPDDPTRLLPHGESGEIGICGIGLARGYVGRDDLTAKAFLDGVEGAPGRVYRTGDLGRVTPDGEIEYQGRIDLQVKVRGYRIELTEIESVLLQVDGVAAAVVDTRDEELVGWYSERDGGSVDPGEAADHLRDRLPPYMVPAYLEPLDDVPLTPQGKVDRRALPAPTHGRVGGPATEHVEADGDTERVLADALAATLGAERVSVQAHFFDELGANSLLMARFSARAREALPGVALSIRDLYRTPTVRGVAATLDGDRGPALPPDPRDDGAPPLRASTARYLLTGAAQLLVLLAALLGASAALVAAYGWVAAAPVPLETAVRSLAVGAGGSVTLAVAPVVLKWLLVGRFTEREFPLWGATYLRFWIVRRALQVGPMQLFAGTALYSVYLRALGARIGAGTVIHSSVVPTATDLLTIGARSVVREDAYLTGYRVLGGRVQTGRITLGDDVTIGEKTVLDIGTSMGDGAQLGHASSLPAGVAVPAGERRHGSPAEPTDVDHRAVEPVATSALRPVLYGAVQVAGTALVAAPLAVWGVVALLGVAPEPPTTGAGWAGIALWSGVLFTATVLLGLLAATVLPRLLGAFVRPDTVHGLHGVRHLLQRRITRVGNSPYLMRLFGDSSFVLGYLRAVGYRLPDREQTGSNVGIGLRQADPRHVTMGSGTMVSDGLAIHNVDHSASSFRVVPTAIGARNFLGNDIGYPAHGRTGDNVLLGTKVMVPIDGPVRSDTGLLGSPPFEIPRTVDSDHEFDDLRTGRRFRRLLAAKNRYNARTIALFLLSGWLRTLGTVAIAVVAAGALPVWGALAVAGGVVAGVSFNLGYSILLERLVAGFRSLRPRFCSIYDPYFWWHERFWKFDGGALYALFDGTPFKGLVWRAVGVRTGRRLFDDGAALPERSLVTIGDDVTLNAGSIVQGHSMEDGTFKSDHAVLGDGVTLGTAAFVHYGTTVDDGAVLAADAFLMKGEHVGAGARWWGNPAQQRA